MKVKHLVIIPDSVKSKRISAVGLALRLYKAGYRITFVGPGGGYSQIDIFDYRRVDLRFGQETGTPPESYQKFGKTGLWFWQHQNRCTRQAEVIEAVNTKTFQSSIEDLSPDLLLIDVEAHPYILSSISQNLPVALFSVFFNLWKRPGVPTLHSDIVPGKGLAGKPLLIEWQWLRFRLWKWIINKRNFLLSGGMDWLSLLRCYAESLGLKLEQHVDLYQWLIPCLYEHLPTLVLNPGEMEFPLRQPSGITYVGPMLCTNRSKLAFLPETENPLLKLEELLDGYRNGRPDKCLIYCSFGAYFSGDDIPFLKKLAMAFIGTDWDVIIALGNRVGLNKLGALPENVLCVGFAPQMEILSVSDCAVIHGGMTTVYECIHYGVPMVLYPFKVNDQLGTAARIQYHQLGLVGNRSKDSTSKIRERIAKAMGDRLIRNNSERLRQNISRYTDEKIAAKSVENIITKYRNSSRSTDSFNRIKRSQ